MFSNMRNQSIKSYKKQSNCKGDVVDRFLTILWKKEVDFKLTTK